MYNSKKGWSLYHPGKVGAFPLDESVYGVRDLAGSVMEPTSDLTVAGDKFISFRSGHWRTGDEFMSCVASRNGFLAEYPGPDAGIRLVAIPAKN
jgi:formylglycine-generating enzyme required for sulfatase activity